MTETPRAPRVDSSACATAIQEAVGRFIETQASAISAASGLVVDAMARDGILQVFGTGHSQAIVMEIVDRAGGLVAASALSLRDLSANGPEVAAAALHPTAERDPTFAAKVLDAGPVHPEDIFVIASNSGINGVVVEMARLVKQRGHRLVAITSLEHSRAERSRHPSRLRLHEIADVTIDNCAPVGDGLLPLPSGGSICAVSTITGAIAAQMLVTEVIRGLLELGREPEIYVSANTEGSDDRNLVLEARYAGRLRGRQAW